MHVYVIKNMYPTSMDHRRGSIHEACMRACAPSSPSPGSPDSSTGSYCTHRSETMHAFV
jgi:hypothetical protein